MAGIAILGYGVIGSGVAKAVRNGSDMIFRKTGERVELLRILDLLDFPDSEDAAIISKDADAVIGDPRVDIVVETMGGVGAAYEFSKKALSLGKHLVTSNKDLVCAHGPELMGLARDNGVRYLFEAAVGGGMPILRPLANCLAANRIKSIEGIVNGTTNYILTRMHEERSNYETVLAEAQSLGYAERDPSSDVKGLDAARKLAILASTATGMFVDWQKIPTTGITAITLEDVRRAEELGCVIKLVARARFDPGAEGTPTVAKDGRVPSLSASVAPTMIKRDHPFYKVSGAYNAAAVEGDLVGKAYFFGVGAGKEPTSSAALGDVIDIIKNRSASLSSVWDRNHEISPSISRDESGELGLFYARLNASGANAINSGGGGVGGVDVNIADADVKKRALDAIFAEFPDATLLPRGARVDNGDDIGGGGGEGSGGESCESRENRDGEDSSLCFTAAARGDRAFDDRLSKALRSRGIAERAIEARMQIVG